VATRPRGGTTQPQSRGAARMTPLNPRPHTHRWRKANSRVLTVMPWARANEVEPWSASRGSCVGANKARVAAKGKNVAPAHQLQLVVSTHLRVLLPPSQPQQVWGEVEGAPPAVLMVRSKVPCPLASGQDRGCFELQQSCFGCRSEVCARKKGNIIVREEKGDQRWYKCRWSFRSGSCRRSLALARGMKRGVLFIFVGLLGCSVCDLNRSSSVVYVRRRSFRCLWLWACTRAH